MARQAAESGDDGTNDLLVSDVIRTERAAGLVPRRAPGRYADRPGGLSERRDFSCDGRGPASRRRESSRLHAAGFPRPVGLALGFPRADGHPRLLSRPTGARCAATRWRSTTRSSRSSSSIDAQLLGISVDGAWCHSAFAEARKLRFPLLADFEPKGAVARRYGVYREAMAPANVRSSWSTATGTIRWSYVSPIGVNPGADGILEALEKRSTRGEGRAMSRATRHAASVPSATRPRAGPADAPVTLVEYGDYECPHCGAAHPIVQEVRSDRWAGRPALRVPPLPARRSPSARRSTRRRPRRRPGRRASSGRCTTSCSRTSDALERRRPRSATPTALGLDVERFASELAAERPRGRGARRTS